ncbi:hypothetical protein AA309_14075 [Microvirga vignae]|uniref:Uncharacterized protein n=2 Tax=Microvirga vignae TaxID=1225564 RepID=A0A0H1RIN2_9HYPH|nr:hypothetical protein AA309_14075 [Microvirga vignae]
MGYQLRQLASGSYDLLLGNEIIGSAVCSGSRSKSVTWIAELLDDSPATPRPSPFAAVAEESEALRRCAGGWEALPFGFCAKAMTCRHVPFSDEVTNGFHGPSRMAVPEAKKDWSCAGGAS